MEDTTCKICGKSKSTDKSGSITQFLSLCSCDLLATDRSNAPELKICELCGKRIDQGRSGTITQFVFRSDNCSCQRPVTGIDSRESSGKIAKGPAFAGYLEDNDQPELDLPADEFPRERYMPLTEIARGASGTVYKARDKVLKKIVAVKTLHVLNADDLIQFQEEARATSRLDHRNIVDILDFGATDSGIPYMVLEHLPGRSLDLLLDEFGPLPWEQVKAIARELALALEHAHRQGVFHRDIKPSNVICTKLEPGSVELKLIDFGIAKLSELTGQLTEFQGKTMAGTPTYMSPDIPNGYSYTAGSEIYSLGCLLYELLSGQPPFKADTALETMAMHANNEAPSLNTVSSNEIPLEASNLLAACIAKNPEERPQSMESFLSSLEEIERAGESSNLTDTQIENEDQELESPDSKRKKTRPGTLLLVVTASILLIGLVAVFFFQGSNSKAKKKVLKKPSVASDRYLSVIDTLKRENQTLDPFQAIPSQTVTEKKAFPVNQNMSNEELDVTAENILIKAVDRGSRPDKFGMVEIIEATDSDLAKISEEGEENQSLKMLNIKSKTFTGEGFKHINGQDLKKIILYCPSLTNQGLRNLTKFKKLETIYFASAPGITAQGIAQLGQLPLLSTIEVSIDAVNPDFFRGIPALKHISYLYVRSNNTFIHTELIPISGCKTITTAKFSKVIFDERIADILATLPNLKRLELLECRVSSGAYKTILDLPISSLRMNHTPCTGEQFLSFAQIKSLKILSVVNNDKIDTFYRRIFTSRRPDVKVKVADIEQKGRMLRMLEEP